MSHLCQLFKAIRHLNDESICFILELKTTRWAKRGVAIVTEQ